MVTNELRGEKVDIVPYSEDMPEFVMRALQPAKVKEVRLDEETGTATVIVPDYQLSLAIGKEGQNARLAARLSGWRVDIKSETQLQEEEDYANQDWAEGEWVTDEESGELVWKPAEGGEVMSVDAYAQAGDADADADADAGDADAGGAVEPGDQPGPVEEAAIAGDAPEPATEGGETA
jgi:N utilization substance protein A